MLAAGRVMKPLALFTVVDGDLRRRVAITHCLAGSTVHVEPLETVDEAMEHWPRGGLILAHDEGDAIPALANYMDRTGKWLPLIAYREAPQPPQVVQAILAGAMDYISWPFSKDQIVELITETECRARQRAEAHIRKARARNRIELLTCREREVLLGIAGGLSNRRIADQLTISPRTVENHRANMLAKMGTAHVSEAIRIAIEAELLN
jgi:two-component system response regulator FixJ